MTQNPLPLLPLVSWSTGTLLSSSLGDVEGVEDTKKKGALHYPSHPVRLQFGIWDASAPAGTSEWAHGPIDWDLAPRRMSAVFKSVEVQCPY